MTTESGQFQYDVVTIEHDGQDALCVLLDGAAVAAIHDEALKTTLHMFNVAVTTDEKVRLSATGIGPVDMAGRLGRKLCASANSSNIDDAAERCGLQVTYVNGVDMQLAIASDTNMVPADLDEVKGGMCFSCSKECGLTRPAEVAAGGLHYALKMQSRDSSPVRKRPPLTPISTPVSKSERVDARKRAFQDVSRKRRKKLHG